MIRFLTLGLLFFASCDINSTTSETMDKVKNAKSTWSTSNPQNYTYLFQRVCFCFFTEEVKIVVQADSVIAVEDPNTNLPIMVDFGGELVPLLDVSRSAYFTINKFFERLEVEVPVADVATVEFNGSNGMPVEIYFDFDKNASDDEISYRFRELQIN